MATGEGLIPTNWRLKQICEEIIIIAENQLPLVDDMTLIEIGEFIDEESDLPKNLTELIISNDVYQYEIEDIITANTKLEDVSTAIEDDDLSTAAAHLIDALNLAINGANSMKSEVFGNAFDYSIRFIADSRAARHLSFPNEFVSAMAKSNSLLNIAFLEGSSGDLHFNKQFVDAWSKRFGEISLNGVSVYDNCVIIDLKDLVIWAQGVLYY